MTELRTKRSWSRTDLASRAGISYGYLWALNRDQRVDGIARLADTITWHLIHVLEKLEKGVE